MSLATRCTACGTIFRVVQDQLKVSEGWVRCGRCDAVFNAMQGLFDLERDALPEWPAKAQTVPAVELASSAPMSVDLHANSTTPSTSPELQLSHAPAPALARATSRFPTQADSEFTPSAEPSSEPHSADPVHAVALVEPEESSAGFADFMASERALTEPDFVRHADNAQRWKQSSARLVLALTAVLLLALVGVQAAHHFRDTLAARWPQAKPALVSACGWLRCNVGLPQRIDDLAVESTALMHTIPGSEAFKLSVSLRNRGHLPVALPSVDLSLTDASGQLVARRALAPIDFQANLKGLNPSAETTLSLMMTANDERVTGYSVEVFYP